MENILSKIDQHILDTAKLIGQVVEFTVFSQKHFGRILSFDQKFGTFIVKDFYILEDGTKSTINGYIELEKNEIEKVYTEPMFYYISWEFEFLVYSTRCLPLDSEDIFPIRVSELANNPELLKFTPFVGTQVEEDNKKWFSGYMTALNRFDEKTDRNIVRNLLISDVLLVIRMSKKYSMYNQFIEVYEKLDQSVKQ